MGTCCLPDVLKLTRVSGNGEYAPCERFAFVLASNLQEEPHVRILRFPGLNRLYARRQSRGGTTYMRSSWRHTQIPLAQVVQGSVGACETGCQELLSLKPALKVQKLLYRSGRSQGKRIELPRLQLGRLRRRCKRSWATGSWSSARSPCLADMVYSFLAQGVPCMCRDWGRRLLEPYLGVDHPPVQAVGSPDFPLVLHASMPITPAACTGAASCAESTSCRTSIRFQPASGVS